MGLNARAFQQLWLHPKMTVIDLLFYTVLVCQPKLYVCLQVRKGDGWVHLKQAGLFGFNPEYVVYACLHPDGDVYELTEGAKCQGLLDSETFLSSRADCCKVWFTFGPQTTHKDRQKQQQQDQRQERYTRHQQQQQQSTSENAGGRKKGRKGRKRR